MNMHNGRFTRRLAARVLAVLTALSVMSGMVAFSQTTAYAADKSITGSETGLTALNIRLADGTTIDTVNNGDKDTKYGGNTVELFCPDKTKYSLTAENVELKGRGNYTWSQEKKPYQIKFDSKTDVLGMGKAKKWVLLANFTDCSLMRNKLAFDLADAIGMPYISQGQWVDLYADGVYQGNYLLCEKAEVGGKRVDLSDDEGLMVELDNLYYQGEDVWFRSRNSGSYFTLKESVADDVGKKNSVAEAAFGKFEDYLNSFEALLYAENKDWDAISAMIDEDSFVRFFFMQELSEDPDSCRSSYYMYKDGDGDELHMGPVWDYDIAFGNYSDPRFGGDPCIDYIANISEYREMSLDWFTQLFKIKEFRNLARDIYNSDIKPEFNKATALIDSYNTTALNASAALNFAKWQYLGKASPLGNEGHRYETTYAGEVAYLRDWVARRVAYLNSRYPEVTAPSLEYCAHVSNIGWMDTVTDGGTAGITDGSEQLEAITADVICPSGLSGDIEYRTFVAEKGQLDWVKNGDTAGTVGESRHAEALEMRLTGKLSEQYDLYYRVYADGYGWLGWAKNGETAGTLGFGKKLEAVQLMLKAKNEAAPGSTDGHCIEKPITANIFCSPHVANVGWMNVVSDGAVAGKVGKEQLEAVKIAVSASKALSGSVEYRAFASGKGWDDWGTDDHIAGTTGESRALEAVEVRLTGNYAERFDVYYSAYAAGLGWLGWAKNGEPAGFSGYDSKLEGLRLMLVAKGGSAPGSTSGAFKGTEPSADITYSIHCQNDGWLNAVADGMSAGVAGSGKRIEAFRLSLNMTGGLEGGISYRAKVEDKGWLNWVSSGEDAGTQDEHRQLEAIEIKLSGAAAEKYDICYRLYVNGRGWLGWAKNGESAGCSGGLERIESMQIALVAKNSAAPGSCENAYIEMAPAAGLDYTAYSINSGWLAYQANGGTLALSSPLETLRVRLSVPCGGGVEYRVFDKNGKWTDPVSDNAATGLIDKQLGFSAVEVRLTGAAADKYDVKYRVLSGNKWSEFATNGTAAGIPGGDLITAVEMGLVEKPAPEEPAPEEPAPEEPAPEEPAPEEPAPEEPAPEEPAPEDNNVKLTYSGHVQGIGWQAAAADGETAGTINEQRRLEALTINIEKPEDMSGMLSARAFVAEKAWLDWMPEGEVVGTVNEQRMVKAIEMKLSGELADSFDVYYRSYNDTFGWLGWAKNGETSGAVGYGGYISAVQIKLIKKGEAAPGDTAHAYRLATKSVTLTYIPHIENIGWSSPVISGDTAGKTGMRLEAIRFGLSAANASASGDILCRVRAAEKGWLDWVSGGDIAGTTGEARQLEAIEIKLDGQYAQLFTVNYRIYVSGMGWQGWVSDGGTADAPSGRRVEAVQVQLAEK